MLRKLCLSWGFFLATTAMASAAQDCSAEAILKPNVIRYDQNILTFLAYSTSIDQLVKQNQSSGLGANYNGFSLSYDDAKSLASMYSSRTNLALSQDASISLISSVIPPEARRDFIDCIRLTKSNIELVTKPGAQFQEAFQGEILWHPTYSVENKPTIGDEREVKLVITNGTLDFGDGSKLRPQQDAPFRISRLNLDKPLYLTALIDNKVSDQLEFPARPKQTVRTELREVKTEPFHRSGHYGPEQADWGPFCAYPTNGGILLPSTAVASKSGGGHEYDARTSVTISSSSPLAVCITVHSKGTGSTEEKHGHHVQGSLTVAEAFMEGIKYEE